MNFKIKHFYFFFYHWCLLMVVLMAADGTQFIYSFVAKLAKSASSPPVQHWSFSIIFCPKWISSSVCMKMPHEIFSGWFFTVIFIDSVIHEIDDEKRENGINFYIYIRNLLIEDLRKEEFFQYRRATRKIPLQCVHMITIRLSIKHSAKSEEKVYFI